jgi:glucans biosynthesis protein C
MEVSVETEIKKARFGYVDDVKSLVIFLVVLLHSSVTFSGLGSWYVVENRSDSIGFASLVLCGLFNSFNQAWFMGIMFFFAGFLAREAWARKTPGTFVRDRVLRLGIPLAAYMLVINPVMMYYLAYHAEWAAKWSFADFYVNRYIGSLWVFGGTGPLWFAETLLVFSLAFALAMSLRGGRHCESRKQPSLPSLALIALLTAAFAFAVRVFLPIGTSFANLQFCFFPSYVVLFILGVRGSSGFWFASLTRGKNARLFGFALGAGIPCWILVMVCGGALRGDMTKLYGGFTIQSASYCLWESFVAIAMSVGLPAVFANASQKRQASPRSGGQGALSLFLSRNSFTVFVFHPVFLIALTKLFHGWLLPPPVKALAVGILAWSFCMLFAELVIRRIPGIRNYF